MEDDYTSESKRFAEEMGLIIEQLGMPRMAGRILGWMFVSGEEFQSIDELAGALQASRGSISTMTRLLIHSGMLERVALPGQRRDHFRIKSGNWGLFMQARFRWIITFRETLDRGLALTHDKDDKTQKPLRELRDLYAFIESEFPALYERWEKERLRKES